MMPETLESADRTGVPDSTSHIPDSEDPADGSSEPERLSKAARFVRNARRSASRSAWQVLGQRDFRRYFIGSLISNLGTWLQSTAQVLIAYQVTHSVLTVGLIASAQFAGMVVSPWAPVLADRFSPRVVLVGTQGFSALIAILMAGLHFAGMLGVGWLLAGALGLGFAFALALPVQTALVPVLVREENAADAVKMNSVSYNAGRALAPAMCVPVIILIGPTLIFALNAISFVIFVIILRNLSRIADNTSLRRTFRDMFDHLLRVIEILPLIVVRRACLSRTTYRATATYPGARVRDGLITALRRRRLLLLLAIVAAVTLADDPILVLSPAVAARLHMPSASAGYFIAALGWGSVLGSLPPTSANVKTAQYASRRAAISLLFLGASIVVFTLGFSFKFSLGAVIVAGGAGFFTGTAAQTALLRHHQKNGPDVAAVASVAALWAIAWAGTKPFASFLDGLLAARIGIFSTSIALTAPAIIIALCELTLPACLKRRINDWANWIISRIVPDADSSAPVYPGAEPAPLSDEMTLTDATPTASRIDEGPPLVRPARTPASVGSGDDMGADLDGHGAVAPDSADEYLDAPAGGGLDPLTDGQGGEHDDQACFDRVSFAVVRADLQVGRDRGAVGADLQAGDVSLQPSQGSGLDLEFAVDAAGPAGQLDEAFPLDRRVAGDDLLGPSDLLAGAPQGTLSPVGLTQTGDELDAALARPSGRPWLGEDVPLPNALVEVFAAPLGHEAGDVTEAPPEDERQPGVPDRILAAR